MSNRTPEPQSKLSREVLKPLRVDRTIESARAWRRDKKSLLPELVQRARKAALKS